MAGYCGQAIATISACASSIIGRIGESHPDLAVGIASKVVEREIQPKDHEAFVDEFIRNVGDEA